MMSKEEVAEIITYCREHNVRQCDRLKELGIASWRFYDARRKYTTESEKQVIASDQMYHSYHFEMYRL